VIDDDRGDDLPGYDETDRVPTPSRGARNVMDIT